MSPVPGQHRFVRRYVIALVATGALLAVGIVGVNVGINAKLRKIRRVHSLPLDNAPSTASAGNFLLVGSDSRAFVQSGNQAQAFGSAAQVTGQRSDTIIVLHIDPSRKHTLLASIPRDTLVQIPGMGTQKINAAFNAGPQRVITTIQQNFNVPITHYVEVGFDSFQGIVDAIGHVPVTFPAPAFDTCTGLYEPAAGTYELNGAQALQYVRARHLRYYINGQWRLADPLSDLNRIGRQQSFLRTLAVLAYHRAVNGPFAANAIADSVVSKLTVDDTLGRGDILGLVRAFRQVNPADPTGLETTTVPTTPDVVTIGGLRQDILRPQEPAADALFARLRTFGATAAAPPSVAPSQVSVRVLNGSGVNGAASRALQTLTTQFGFAGAGTGNAAHVGATEVRSGTRGRAGAGLVLAYLGGTGRLVDDPSTHDATVTIVVGPDFRGVQTPAASASGSAPPPTPTTVAQPTTTTGGVYAPKPPQYLAAQECR